MPPQWWLIPNLLASNNGGTEETIHLMNQVSHYHLLIRLHLPYMLRPSLNRRYDHSKITAVNASRESLARFVAFRTSNPAHFYCRGTDFLAFIATTVLCLAHIDSRGRPQSLSQDSNPGIAFNFLAHSRPSDRGMMERTLDMMESMAHDGTDATSSKISYILRHLLAIESNAANGASYSTNSSKGDEEDLECHGKLTNGGKALHVHIPHFGTINFEHRPLQFDQLASPQHALSLANGRSNFSTANTQEGQLSVSMGIPGAEDNRGLQGVDVAIFDSLFRGTEIPDTVEEESWAQWASNL